MWEYKWKYEVDVFYTGRFLGTIKAKNYGYAFFPVDGGEVGKVKETIAQVKKTIKLK